MPRFEPFAGLRYDTQVAPLAEVIAPPYDVVGPAERERLAARSAYSSIHLELPVPDDERGLDRYEHAAALLRSWERDGVLRQDDAPAFYVYTMRFRGEDGSARSTTGVIGALQLDETGGSEVLPHERTMPKPKGDRLELLRTCRANLSPIWGLSLTAGLAAACTAATRGGPAPMSATDDDGIVHELWPVSDPEAIASIASLVAATPVVIADGHHRYETATFYQSERRRASGDAPGAYDAVMALVVELSPDELVVQAIHRLVAGLPEELDAFEALGAHLEVLDGPEHAADLPAEMAEVGAIGLVTRQGNYLLRPRPALLEAAEADLDSSRLDVALASLPAHEIAYQHGTRAVIDAVADGTAQLGFLLRPATVEQIADTAHSGRRMPPKTTFFHPKPRTGLVLRSVPD
jgi:uncharacterized protein (DUF1015 family)